MKHSMHILAAFIAVFILFGCSKRYVPKPVGYYRIDLPEARYSTLQGDYPYQFEVSDITIVSAHNTTDEKYWIDISYPTLNAKLHCSYKPISHNLRELSVDAEEFVYKHIGKADAIPEQEFANEDDRVYGVLYELKGNTASPLQFYLTDSVRHFFRASLYFDCVPNQDSLAPLVEYIETDTRHLIETFRWR